MLLSISLMLILGMLLAWICKKLHLPGLLGMIITGIILGPYVLNLIDSSILDMSQDLRKIALIIILMRAGLSLNISDLKKVGRPAVLMCFLPACFEILGTILIAPKLLNISVTEAAVLGAVLGAVSPAVIVPKMLSLIENGYGADKSIPQLILAGASVDDIFVIVMFTAFTGLAQGSAVSFTGFLSVPVSIITGLSSGLIAGYILSVYFKRVHIRDTVKVIILLCVSFLMAVFENTFSDIIPFSSLIAVMGLGIALQKKHKPVSDRLSIKFNKLWVCAEILLFVLVGAAVNIEYAASAGIASILLIFAALIFRMAGVLCCLVKTSFNIKERIFCMISYIPKATVQAAIGGIPLSMGLACGDTVLTCAVLAILITAPLGAFLIDLLYKRLLQNKTDTA